MEEIVKSQLVQGLLPQNVASFPRLHADPRYQAGKATGVNYRAPSRSYDVHTMSSSGSVIQKAVK